MPMQDARGVSHLGLTASVGRAASALLVCWAFVSGCASPQANSNLVATNRPLADPNPSVALVSHQAEPPLRPLPDPEEIGETTISDSLEDLEVQALEANPRLQRLWHEAAAAHERALYIGALPNPRVGFNAFTHPIETAAGSQRANLSITQSFPWLQRLDAQSQQACLDAVALDMLSEAETLRVIGDIRARWYRLYVLSKEIEINRANQEILQSLIDTAVATLATGNGAASDVRLGNLEYSKLEERALSLSQQLVTETAELNRLVGREAEFPIAAPGEIESAIPDWSHAYLRQLAWDHQPAIAAARLRAQAASWGLEVARLERRPDIALNASWFAIDDNRPLPSVVQVGEDAWSLGAQVTIPLWRNKHDAMEREAAWRHAASHASVDEAVQQADTLLRQLWERAKTAHQTSQLYEETILPEARETLAVDTEAYANGEIGFDRLLRDFRGTLTLEIGYHQARADLATSLARIRQATGMELGG